MSSLNVKLREAYLMLFGEAVQFERLGYFCADDVEPSAKSPVLNRIITLRDSWAKIEKQAMS